MKVILVCPEEGAECQITSRMENPTIAITVVKGTCRICGSRIIAEIDWSARDREVVGYEEERWN